jgi:hypothetical protein
MMSRINPFENLSEDFPIKPKSQSIENEKESINQIAEDNNFPSRQAIHKEQFLPTTPIKQQRRYRTGRNQQLNIKATEQTINKFYRLADKENITLGELLERALNALEKS